MANQTCPSSESLFFLSVTLTNGENVIYFMCLPLLKFSVENMYEHYFHIIFFIFNVHI